MLARAKGTGQEQLIALKREIAASRGDKPPVIRSATLMPERPKFERRAEPVRNLILLFIIIYVDIEIDIDIDI